MEHRTPMAETKPQPEETDPVKVLLAQRKQAEKDGDTVLVNQVNEQLRQLGHEDAK